MRATIGITAGDPAGIGLEVVLKSISSVLKSAARPLTEVHARAKISPALWSCCSALTSSMKS